MKYHVGLVIEGQQFFAVIEEFPAKRSRAAHTKVEIFDTDHEHMGQAPNVMEAIKFLHEVVGEQRALRFEALGAKLSHGDK